MKPRVRSLACFLSLPPQHSVDNQAFSSPLCKHHERLLLTWKPYRFILALAFRLLRLHAETSVICKRLEKPGNLWFVLSHFSPRVTPQTSTSEIIPFARSHATRYELPLLLRSLLEVQKASASEALPCLLSPCHSQALPLCNWAVINERLFQRAPRRLPGAGSGGGFTLLDSRAVSTQNTCYQKGNRAVGIFSLIT